jgi:hypothetical protein
MRPRETQLKCVFMSTATIQAKDLSKEAPRSPRVRLRDYALLARAIDKCRAEINGTPGSYHFACPLDQMLFTFKGVDENDVKRLVESGADDEKIALWLDANGIPKTPEEVKAWSDMIETYRPYDDPEKRDWFVGECQPLGLDPAKVTLLDYLETDDRVSFKK